MAEYASALVGLATFGLQVCKGIAEYYDSFKNQNRSIARTIRDVDNLQDLFIQVTKVLQRDELSLTHRTIDSSIKNALEDCNLALSDLETEINKINTNRISKDSTVSDILANGIRRAKYPFRESTLMKLQESIKEARSTLTLAFDIRHSITLDSLEFIATNTSVALGSLNERFKSSEAQKWLNAPDPWSDLYTTAEKRHPGTGQWLLNADTVANRRYRQWKLDVHSSFLWLIGFPGSGKSVLASSIIEDITQALPANSAIAFYYFNFRDQSKQSVSGLLKSLALQLNTQCSGEILEQFHNERAYHQPSDKDLLDLVISLIEEVDCAYVVVDGVDECPSGRLRESVIKVLNRLRGADGMHLIITSRDEIDLRQLINVSDAQIMVLRHFEVQRDIELVVREHLLHNKKLQKWHAQHVDIERALTKQSQGMFRWVECQFIQLEQCRTANALRSCLSALPLTLNETYDRILENIDMDTKSDLKRALTFLCFSLRPIMVCELVDAMAIHPDQAESFDVGNRIEDVDDLLGLLPGLLSLTPWQNGEHIPGYGTVAMIPDTFQNEQRYHKIHFAHASVKDYFLSDGMTAALREFQIIASHAHDTIASCCIQYSLHAATNLHLLTAEDRLLEVYPFVRYAAEEFFEHMRLCKNPMDYYDNTVRLFKADSFMIDGVAHSRKRLYCDDRGWKAAQFLNLSRIPQSLHQGLSAKQKDQLCATAVLIRSYAMELANKAVKELVSSLESERSTESYISEVMLWLLAQVQSVSGPQAQELCFTLSKASLHSRKPNDLLYTALLCRHAYWGDLSTLRSLLPADSALAMGLSMNPVDYAKLGESVRADGDSLNTIGLLSWSRHNFLSPMCGALQGHQQQLVCYFTEQGCFDWCKSNKDGQRALDITLCAAAAAGSLANVELLLSNGADVAYSDETGTGLTALHRAVFEKHTQIVVLLLDHGANVNARTRFGTTPLMFASRKESPELAQLLLDRGANVAFVNTSGVTSLHYAAMRARPGIIRLLLDAGANPLQCSNASGSTPRYLLERYLKKWSNFKISQRGVPAAMAALKEGEKQWLASKKHLAVAGNTPDDKVNPAEDELIPSHIGKQDQGTRPLETNNSQDQLLDVVDIFIEVPQSGST